MFTAFEEMNVRGIHFTMADLARQLAVSKSTLYQYFVSKDELIGAIMEAAFNDIRQQEEEIAADPALPFLEKMARMLGAFPRIFGPINNRLIEDTQRYMPKEMAKVEEFNIERWQRIEELIKTEIAEGRLRPINLAVLHRIYLSAKNGLGDYKFLSQYNLSAKEALTAFADIITFGLVNTDKDLR